VALAGPDGAFGPPLRVPDSERRRRAFTPSLALTGGGRGVVVYNEAPASGSTPRTAPVRAAPLGPGGVGRSQSLTRDRAASEPLALPLSGGRALAIWSGNRRIAASLADRRGRFRRIAAPDGAGPDRFHDNSTNRDASTAGRWAIVGWAGRSRGPFESTGRTRVAIGRP